MDYTSILKKHVEKFISVVGNFSINKSVSTLSDLLCTVRIQDKKTNENFKQEKAYLFSREKIPHILRGTGGKSLTANIPDSYITQSFNKIQNQIVKRKYIILFQL